MADKMMRVAGRGNDGMAKAISTDDSGRLNFALDKEIKSIEKTLNKNNSIVDELKLDIFKNKADFETGAPDWVDMIDGSLVLRTHNIGDNGVKVMYFTDDDPIMAEGKYFKFWLDLANDIEDYQFFKFSISTSKGSWDVIHQINMTEELGLVSGGQWVEAHIDDFNVKVGDLNYSSGITRMQFEVRGETGRLVEATVSNLSIVQKRPYIVYGFDGAYPGVVEDAVNYNLSRNIPFFIQLTPHNADELPEGNPDRTSSLDKVKRILDTGLCSFGIHFDAKGLMSDGLLEETSPISEYRKYYREQIGKLRDVGLLDDQPSHATALKNHWKNETHHSIVRGHFPVLRSGHGTTLTSTVVDGKYHYQSPSTEIKDMPFYDLDQETPTSVKILIDNLVKDQYGLYLYSHGTHYQLSNPDYLYQTTPETFESFWDVIDYYKGHIRFLSIEELINEYDYVRLGKYNYRDK